MLNITGLEFYATPWPFILSVVIAVAVAVWIWFMDDDWVMTALAFIGSLIFTIVVFAAVFSVSVSSQQRAYLHDRGYIILDDEDGYYEVLPPEGEMQIAQFNYVSNGQYQVTIR